MSGKLDALAQRRDALSSEIALHRVELALAAQRLRPPLRRIDELRQTLRDLRTHYSLLLVPVVLLAVLNPRPALKLALAALAAWRAFEQSAGPAPVRLLESLSVLAERRRP